MKLKNKTVLITGACGFIGSHLVERLLEENCNVKAFVYYNSFNSWGWLDTLSKDKLKNIEVFTGDIRDHNGICAVIKNNNIDIVFHLAALIGIPFSYNSPDSYVETNIKGTLNILQACRNCNIERVVVTSTSEVYGTARYIPIDEKHPLQSQSPYSASKIGADAIAESFYRSFDVPVVIARPFNTYGPRQSARALIPTIITQLLNNSSKIRLGSLHPTRDLTYVSDTCEGFVAVAKCSGAIGKVVNIGSGQEITVGNLAKLIIEQINPKAKIVSDSIRKRPEKSEVERLLCDNTVIKEMTNWKPKVSLKEGIKKTIDWFSNKQNFTKYKWDIYNV
ncbi:MAG: NAD-dependent 4,6-dehydratase LegB [Candidatus Omnitrophica bacterium]|nr:NAD-dependent 4,6-dehydratase LegB [Candidatus Omnitrophota bacterium]MDD5352425.1 NAD-dependent 4,6-dehydratase LegB [Candidatus Omnitrophota bacterium]MDD5550023.1 NAD-dependent 4,6-dehydratase LegB [Candidatus Omnitrophota bacterium]